MGGCEELALASLKFAGQASRMETQGRLDVAAQVQRQSGGRIPSPLGDFCFSLLRPSIDWIQPTHHLECDSYSVYCFKY